MRDIPDRMAGVTQITARAKDQMMNDNKTTIEQKDPESDSLTYEYLPKVRKFLSSIFSIVDESTVEISHVRELLSAQQCVLILTMKEGFIDKLCSDGEDNEETSIKRMISCALKTGDNRIVLRIWRGGASWWNLNSNSSQSSTELAKAEVAGYRVALRALTSYNKLCEEKHCEQNDSERWDSTSVVIPELIYFSHDDDHLLEMKDEKRVNSSAPWAIFSYVGKGSFAINKNFDDTHFGRVMESYDWVCCELFVRNMIKTRFEFGFEEPHPRHGRVCEEQALDYSMHVLDSVILPLHSTFFYSRYQIKKTQDNTINLLFKDSASLSRVHADNKSYLDQTTTQCAPMRYHHMIKLYKKKVAILKEVASYDQSHNNDGTNRKMCVMIDVLSDCVDSLISEAKSLHCNLFLEDEDENDNGKIIPAVLCHMDLQPQNMILRQRRDMVDQIDPICPIPQIASVLDWEEACFADPRFELLLLCRKVASNREQADSLWNHYSKTMMARFNIEDDVIGSIDPWLKLETVHSIISLTMQGMDLQGGGRSPWEGKHDLWDKIVRELHRLIELGWGFCEKAVL